MEKQNSFLREISLEESLRLIGGGPGRESSLGYDIGWCIGMFIGSLQYGSQGLLIQSAMYMTR